MAPHFPTQRAGLLSLLNPLSTLLRGLALPPRPVCLWRHLLGFVVMILTLSPCCSFPRRVLMSSFVRKVKSVVVREEGATMIEYGLMVALIAIVAIGGVTNIGTALNTLFQSVVASL